jgi:hypothetical protein
MTYLLREITGIIFIAEYNLYPQITKDTPAIADIDVAKNVSILIY